MRTVKGIAFFGDSVFFGVGASKLEYGCCKLIRKSVDKPVKIKAVPDETILDGLKRLEKQIIGCPDCSHVFVMFGNNDCRINESNVPVMDKKDFKKAYTDIVQKIQSNEKEPIIVGLQPLCDEIINKLGNVITNGQSADKWHNEYNNIARDVAMENNIDFIDIREDLEKEKTFAEDGIHPNDKGHKIIADKIIKYINGMV